MWVLSLLPEKIKTEFDAVTHCDKGPNLLEILSSV